MRILVIPDIHGNTSWEQAIQYKEWDYVVFLGDYVDSFDISDKDIIKNLLNIIAYKKANMEKVFLLRGNHELQYYYLDDRRFSCDGYRYSYALQLNIILKDNKHLMQTTKVIDHYLFSHAGVHRQWFKQLGDYLYSQFDIKDLPVDEQIAFLEQTRYSDGLLAVIGYLRGGGELVGSPAWADKKEFVDENSLIPGYIQIAGHSKVETPTRLLNPQGKPLNIWITDCLDFNKHFLYIENDAFFIFNL